MQRSFQKRATLNHTQSPTIQNQTQYKQVKYPQQYPQQQQSPNFCPIPQKKSSTQQEQNIDEAEYLIIQYRELVSKIREIRGKLYSMGIDPEN